MSALIHSITTHVIYYPRCSEESKMKNIALFCIFKSCVFTVLIFKDTDFCADTRRLEGQGNIV